MVQLHDIYVVLHAGVVVLALAVIFIAWRHRAARGAHALAALMVGVMIWAGAAAAMWYLPTLGEQVFWFKATSLGVWFVPGAVLVLVFDIAGSKRLRSPGSIALIVIASLAVFGIRWLNPGRLYDTAFVAHAIGSYTSYQAVPGPLYDALNALAFAIVIAGLAIVLRTYLRSSGADRTQAAVLLVGGLVPLILGAITESRLVPLGGLDLAPLAFLVTGILWLVAISRGTLLDVLPLARHTLVEQMADGVVVLDGDGCVVDANPSAVEMLRVPRTEMLGESGDAVLSCIQGGSAALRDGGSGHVALPIGSTRASRYVEIGVTPLVVGPGRPPGQLVTLHDATAERNATERLMLARQVYDTANEGIVVTRSGDVERIVDVNEAFCRLTGRSREDTVGQPVSSLYSERNTPEFYKAMDRTLSETGEWRGEVWQMRVDGTEFPSWLSLSTTEDDVDHVRHVVSVFTDITEIKKAEEQLRHNATHDALTGLPNRTLLDDRLEQALARARRAGTGLAVLFLDLDDFKDVNDTLGHAQGDVLLTEVAESIVPVLRESDTVARVGGDEFSIVIADVKDPAQAEVTARRVLKAMGGPHHLDADVHITASIGIALFPADGADAAILMQHADLAMYGAKSQGRNRIQFFSKEFQEGLDRRMVVEKELWGADKEERYFLLYQPQVDLGTGRITGAEALVRLRSRDGTVLVPAEFLPVAEGSELIFEIGDWVLRKACDQLAIIHEVAPDLVMSVNFSARQFGGFDATSLRNALKASGVDARSLALEIAETALAVDPQGAANRLEDLRGVSGLRLSLDGVGTGYSSLTYLRMLRADEMKIDARFVTLLPDDAEARAIVDSIIALAKSLHATVSAEGCETEGQVSFLAANGCDRAQGSYFSPPVSADEFMRVLGKGAFSLPGLAGGATS